MSQLKLVDIKQWFSTDEAAEYVFGKGFSAKDLNEFIEDKKLQRYFKLLHPSPQSENLYSTGLPDCCSSFEISPIECEHEHCYVVEYFLPEGTYPLLAKGMDVQSKRCVAIEVEGQFNCYIFPISNAENNDLLEKRKSLKKTAIERSNLEDFFLESIDSRFMCVEKILEMTPKVNSLYKFLYFVDIDDGKIGFPRFELDRFVNSFSKPNNDSAASKKEQGNLLSIIKTLVQFLIDGSAPMEKDKPKSQYGKPPFKNNAQLIEVLSSKESGYGMERGCSKNNLWNVFKKIDSIE